VVRSWTHQPTGTPMRRALSPVLFAIACCGCAAEPTRHDWVDYELCMDLELHGIPSDRTAAIARLEAHIAGNASTPDRIPPGERAWLAWLHLRAGSKEAARRWIEEERAAHPEAAECLNALAEEL